MLDFTFLYPRANADHLGLIPEFLSEAGPASAAFQINANYQHGGGWTPMKGWVLNDDNSITYPGDPALPPLAEAYLRAERIVVYPHAWVAIIQPDRSFEVARID